MTACLLSAHPNCEVEENGFDGQWMGPGGGATEAQLSLRVAVDWTGEQKNSFVSRVDIFGLFFFSFLFPHWSAQKNTSTFFLSIFSSTGDLLVFVTTDKTPFIASHLSALRRLVLMLIEC